jgi:hypothetical protein
MEPKCWPRSSACDPARRTKETLCFARGVIKPLASSESTAVAFVKDKQPPPGPAPPTPVNEWADQVACLITASSVPGSSKCNGWANTAGAGSPADFTAAMCIDKCVANAIPPGCAQDPHFKCAFAQWDPNGDAERCQVAAKNCTPVRDPDVYHPPGPQGGQGWTTSGEQVWRVTACVLRPGEPGVYEEICAKMANKTSCQTVSQTCQWDP